ncbi:ABC transporter [Haloferax sp. Atlit-12N]|uniref:dockerin type I domain-containing protein n=1 Tax=Haloferax sp. Atlit-12N TaxID=2077203 RepID=UPI000E26D088|nr:dockerin type I domain-containing protein [Haloferax sp. Atlit-12N]RDZ63959.1 ABC transporter [Haloferax sp. Atlit-12N]
MVFIDTESGEDYHFEGGDVDTSSLPRGEYLVVTYARADGGIEKQTERVELTDDSTVTASDAESSDELLSSVSHDSDPEIDVAASVAYEYGEPSYDSDGTVDIRVSAVNVTTDEYVPANTSVTVEIETPNGVDTFNATTGENGTAVVDYDLAGRDDGEYRVYVSSEATGYTGYASFTAGARAQLVPQYYRQTTPRNSTVGVAVHTSVDGEPTTGDPVYITVEAPDGNVTERNVTTGADSFARFTFTTTQTGPYVVRATGPNGDTERATIDSAEYISTVNIPNWWELRPGERASISGTVLTETGEPLANEELTLRVENETDAVVETQTLTTTASGQFVTSWDVPANQTEYRVHYDVTLHANGVRIAEDAELEVENRTTVDDDPVTDEPETDEPVAEVMVEPGAREVGPNGTVTATVSVERNDTLVSDTDVRVLSGIDGTAVDYQTVTTNGSGAATVSFDLPRSLADYHNRDVRLRAMTTVNDSAVVGYGSTRISQGRTDLDGEYGTVPGQSANGSVSVTDANGAPVSNAPVAYIGARDGLRAGVFATGLVTTNASGQASFTYDVPADAQLSVALAADSRTRDFNYWTSPSLSQYDINVRVGDRGNGYTEVAPGETVTVNYDVPDETVEGGVLTVYSWDNDAEDRVLTTRTLEPGENVTVRVPATTEADSYSAMVQTVTADGRLSSDEGYIDVNQSAEPVRETTSVSGRITTTDGTPLVNDTVAFFDESLNTPTAAATTNDTGFYNTTQDIAEFDQSVLQNTEYHVGFYQFNGSESAARADAWPRDGVADIYAVDRINTSQTTTVDAEIPEGHVLNVSVTAENGTAVEDARLRVTHANGSAKAAYGARTNANGLLTLGDAPRPGVELTGNVTVEVAPPADSDAYEETIQQQHVTVTNDTELSFTLAASETGASPANLTGFVETDDGTVPPGEVVLDTRLGASDGDVSSLGPNGEYDLTAAEGAYQVSFVQPSSQVDGVPDLYPLHRVYADESMHLGSDELPSASRLNVTVLDRQGEPADDATVVVAYGGNRVFDSVRGETDSDGRFIFGQTQGVEVAGPDAVPNDYGGNVQVQARGPNGTFVGTRLNVTSDTNLTVRLTDRVNVTGQFVRPDSEPAVNRTTVVLGDTNGTSGGGFARTADDGSFGVSVAENGTYNVKFRQERYGEQGVSFPRDGVSDVYATTSIDVGTAPHDVGAVAVPEAHLLNVSVVDANGDPVENARVTVDHRNNGSVGFVSGSTLPNGTMVLDATGRPGVELVGDLRLTVEAPPNATDLEGVETTETLTLTGDRNVTVQLGDADNATPDAVDVRALATPTTASVNETVSVDLVATNVTDGVGAFETTLNLTNGTAGTITDVTVLGSPHTANVTYGAENDSAAIDAFGMDTAQNGTVTFARVNVTLTSAGTSELAVSETVLGSEPGTEYDVGSERGATLTAVALEPVGESDAAPTDPDGDGTFEDINGDGNVTVSDVQAMFANRNSPAITDNADEFDFSGNGEVNIVDVQRLFVEIRD